MTRQPPRSADAPDETVQDDPPAQDGPSKVTHDPGGGRSSVSQRDGGGVDNDAGAPGPPTN